MIGFNYITGEYNVGTCTFTLTDRKRTDTLGKGGPRRLSVRMYYPVTKESTAGAKKAPAYSERKEREVAKAFYSKKLPEELRYPEHYDVPMIKDARFPLIMFSHGYNSVVEANTLLCCDLASHGYIIASVGHANEAIENDYDNGEYDLFDKKISKVMYDKNVITVGFAQLKVMNRKFTPEEALEKFDEFQNRYCSYLRKRTEVWADDMVFAADAVKERFKDNIDTECGIGVSGHSLGGDTAYYLCRYREGFSCGINIDGALFGDYDDTPMTKPFCQISCKDNLNFETRPFFNTTADTYHVLLDGATHLGFTDVKAFFPLRSFCGKISHATIHKHLAYSHYRFFDIYLKGVKKPFVREDKTGKAGVHYRKI